MAVTATTANLTARLPGCANPSPHLPEVRVRESTLSSTTSQTDVFRPRGICAVIHQPYFLPWLGYFSKLCFCDVFVVLDNVHYTKQHFLDRTRIINMHGQVAWLSLPTGQNLGRPIAEVVLRPPDPSSISRLIRTIQVSYARARRFDFEWPFLEKLLSSSFSKSPLTLLEIDLALIRGIADRLGISLPRIVMASAISSAQHATVRLAEITNSL